MPPRSTRNPVLGKRPHQADKCPSSSSSQRSLQLPTPTPTPKRPRTSVCEFDNDGNKENVPPYRIEPVNAPPSPPLRTRRRVSAELATPTRPRIRTRRHSSLPNVPLTPETPSRSSSLRFSSTPPQSPPTPLVPIHVRARALLRATCDGQLEIAGRDEERKVIREFATSFASKNSPSTLYISGSPGSGKTALVNSVLDTLDESDVRVIAVNCMALNTVDALWERLLEEVSAGAKKQRAKSTSVKEGLDRALSDYKTKCILVLDELDHIAKSSSSLVSLLSFPKATSRMLRVIGIANTHTLAAPCDDGNKLCLKTLHFAPYTSAQLLSILQSRLKPFFEGERKDEAAKFLPSTSSTLLAKKIASMTGDVRALLEVLRGAIDKAVDAVKSSDPACNPLDTPAPIVTPAHVLAALKAYTPASTTAKSGSTCSNSETVIKVKNLGLQARLVLLVVFLAARRFESGLPLTFSTSLTKSPTKRTPSPGAARSASTSRMDVSQLHAFYTSALGRAENGIFTPVGRSEFADLLGMLEGVGLISMSGSSVPTSPVKGGKRNLARTTSFGSSKMQGQGQEVNIIEDLRVEEALRGLGIGPDCEPSDVKEEEVKAIWERELARLGREVKGLGSKDKFSDGADLFGGAIED